MKRDILTRLAEGPVLGGCCGSVACHVRAMAEALGKPVGPKREWRSARGKAMSAVEYHEERS